jgi:hypothetical protein
MAMMVGIVRLFGAVMLTMISVVGAAAGAGYGTLAECVRDSGAVLYSASWCPVCKAQRKEFRGYANRIKTVECSVGGRKGKRTAACERMNIKSYPTWVFADGSTAAGLLSARALAERTGCAAPD